MHRLGIDPDQFKLFYTRLSELPFVNTIVAMTHFACAEEQGNAHTQSQITCFNNVVKPFATGKKLQYSLANSAGIVNWQGSHGDWVRP